MSERSRRHAVFEALRNLGCNVYVVGDTNKIFENVVIDFLLRLKAEEEVKDNTLTTGGNSAYVGFKRVCVIDAEILIRAIG